MNIELNMKMRSFLRDLAGKADGMSEGVNSAGGYLVGVDIAKQIADYTFQPQFYTSLPSRYEIVPGKGKINVPIDIDPLQSDPTTGARAYWQSEAAQITTNKAQLSVLTLAPANLVVMVPVTNEMAEDVGNLEEMFIAWGGKACQRKVASEMVVGTGAIAGAGYGGTGSGATLSTALSATPTDVQLQTAFGLLHPSLVQGAVWYVSQAVYAALWAAGLTYASLDRTFGRLTCMGLPVEINPYLSAAKNHVMLGNWRGYALGFKEPRLAVSQVVYYLTDQQAFRLVLRLAGGPQTANSVCQDGVTRGCFVVPS